jgi:hypothetical protein
VQGIRRREHSDDLGVLDHDGAPVLVFCHFLDDLADWSRGRRAEDVGAHCLVYAFGLGIHRCYGLEKVEITLRYEAHDLAALEHGKVPNVILSHEAMRDGECLVSPD